LLVTRRIENQTPYEFFIRPLSAQSCRFRARRKLDYG